MKFLSVFILFGLVQTLDADLLTDLAGIVTQLNNLNSPCADQITTCVSSFLTATITADTAGATTKCLEIVDCYLDESLKDLRAQIMNILNLIIAGGTETGSTGTLIRMSTPAMCLCLLLSVAFVKWSITSRGFDVTSTPKNLK